MTSDLSDDLPSESLFEAPPMGQQERMVEVILFASAEPITVKQLNDRMPHGCDAAEALLRVRKRYKGRGVHVVKIGDAWAIRTAYVGWAENQLNQRQFLGVVVRFLAMYLVLTFFLLS